MFGTRLDAHGAKGETDRGPAWLHGSEVSRRCVSTYRRASADCSFSHKSRPTPDVHHGNVGAHPEARRPRAAVPRLPTREHSVGSYETRFFFAI